MTSRFFDTLGGALQVEKVRPQLGQATNSVLENPSPGTLQDIVGESTIAIQAACVFDREQITHSIAKQGAGKHGGIE